jgi:hypothetical protein
MNLRSSSEMESNSGAAKGVVGEKWHGGKLVTGRYMWTDMTFRNLFLELNRRLRIPGKATYDSEILVHRVCFNA